MNVGEILDKLIKSENYLSERTKVTDQFIDMVRTCMPSHYEHIREKEEAYQGILKLLGGEGYE